MCKRKILDWCNWLLCNKSLRTVEGYEWELLQLDQQLPVSIATWQEVQSEDLTGYLADRRRNGCGDAALKRSVAAMRSFFGWLKGERSPALAVPFPRVRPRAQRCLTQAQALAVMAACDLGQLAGIRDLALICLLLDTGLRESEVCRLTVEQLDLERRGLVVMVKGGRDSRRAYSEYTAAQLRQWLAVRPAVAVETVFVGIGGRTPGYPLTPGGLRAIFRALGRRAGLLAFSPHDLRRTFATLAHKRGAPSRLIQIAGGWADIRQVENYTTSLEASDLDPYSPVAGIMG